MKIPVPLGTLLLVPLGACRSIEAHVEAEPLAGPLASSSWFASPDTQNRVLYPAPEGPQGTPEPGTQWEEGPFPHDMEPTGAGRMYLLELYQQALEDKEALEREVAGLTQALDRTYGELDAHEAELEDARAAVAALEQEQAHLSEENADLGARLATAQIRRLEAEQMLLEAKIEWAVYLQEEEAGWTGSKAAERPAASPRRRP